MRMGLRYFVAALAILVAGIVFLLSAEEEGGVPLIDWIRDPAGSRARQDLSLAQKEAEARSRADELTAGDDRLPPMPLGYTDDGDEAKGLIGRVVQLDGTPVVGADVAAALPAHGLTVTDEEGRFALADVPADSEVLLDGESWVLIGSGMEARPTGGEERLVVVAESSHLSGSVTDEQGRPLADASVVAFLPPYLSASEEIHIPLPLRIERRAQTDADGHFEIEGLPRVPFLTVDVSKPDYLPVRRGAPDDPDQPVTIVLKPLTGTGDH